VARVWKWRLAIVAAAVIAYLPALNNGFIADDYVILHRVELLKADPLYLVDVVPENFRLTSYGVFAAFKAMFGYDARPYFAFNILLHALNCLLLCRVVVELTKDKQLASIAALLFAVFQAPQEAVMWLAAMNETLSGFFVFLTLLLWLRERYRLAALTFLAALFSKESAVIVLLLVPLIDFCRRVRPPWLRYLTFAGPTILFAAVFLITLRGNFQVGNGTYAPSLHAGLVLLKSLHRLCWPWAYVVLIVVLYMYRGVSNLAPIARWGLLVVAAMLPYIFVTYTNNIPSRQTYLASAALVPLLAAGMLRIHAKTLVTIFVALNVVYMWTTKDAQMVERAAPTTALVAELAKHKPGPLRVSKFPYPIALIAKGAAETVPGWKWDDVALGDSCSRCLVLEWNPQTRNYFIASSSETPGTSDLPLSPGESGAKR
jgi:hypothetical protein